MPKAEEYAEAVSFHARQVDLHQLILSSERSESDPVPRVLDSHTKAVECHTLALRWLRVGAAMEAGTLRLDAPRNGGDLWCAVGDSTHGMRCYAPDPLTAAERAMGVGT